MPADLLILDLDGLDRDAPMPVPAKTCCSPAPPRPMWWFGRLVGRSFRGNVLGSDLDATETSLRAAYRAGLPATEPLRAVWLQIERAIGTRTGAAADAVSFDGSPADERPAQWRVTTRAAR